MKSCKYKSENLLQDREPNKRHSQTLNPYQNITNSQCQSWQFFDEETIVNSDHVPALVIPLIIYSLYEFYCIIIAKLELAMIIQFIVFIVYDYV